jgi:RNA polymerase sigma-70 factor (ECF subfamily)
MAPNEAFQSTIWSRILDAAGGNPSEINRLLVRYRPPIVAFLRRMGKSREDAEDLAQEVLLKVGQTEFLRKADRERGRFRDLLLAVTRRTAVDQDRRRSAAKRGGGWKRVPLPGDGGGEDAKEPAAAGPDEEAEFSRLWAANLLQLALVRLRRECRARGTRHFEALRLTQYDGKSYREAAGLLGCKETDITNWVHAGKRRLKEMVGEFIREYAGSDDEWRAELAVALRAGGDREAR